MDRKISWRLVGLVAVWMAIPTASRADSLLDRICHRHSDCPPSMYSCWHYWTPTLVRVYDCFHTHPLEQYPPAIPGVGYGVRIYQYPCPAVDPAVHAKEYP
jgi:hypothetical protein